ncbi:hypothetical protein [Elizabethkingia anophelis]|uniref:hypothetical protein n=1 Tax=Elizabethkingia anophelis TaxID=1117645 RepID=UPI0038914DDC
MYYQAFFFNLEKSNLDIMKNSKSHWRYQVINHGTAEEPSLGIHEIYLNIENNNDCMWTQSPISLNNYNNLEELVKSLELMLKDIEKYPILLESDLEKS